MRTQNKNRFNRVVMKEVGEMYCPAARRCYTVAISTRVPKQNTKIILFNAVSRGECVAKKVKLRRHSSHDKRTENENRGAHIVEYLCLGKAYNI